MARRKNSTALFEVITLSQPSRPPERIVQRDGIFTRAGHWLKEHVKVPPKPEQQSAPAKAPIDKPRAAKATIDRPLSEVRPAVITAVYDADEDAVGYRMDDGESDHGDPDHEDDYAPDQAVAVAVDPEQRKISLHLSYTAALVGAGALALIIGLAILAGQHINRSVPLLTPTTTGQLIKGQPHPEVLDPRRSNFVEPELATSGQQPITPKPAEPRPGQVTTPGDGKRYTGLNYVIIQSYNRAEEKMARDAAAILNKEGISCTVETGVKGYQAIAVVSLQGFERITSPAYRAYVDRIEQVSKKVTSNSRSYKAFAPVPKKWD